MNTMESSAGDISYLDTGGDGPTVLLLHGLLMDETLWTEVVADLRADHRCIVPLLPLGAHRQPVDAHADLSLTGIASLVHELIERLDLADVTLMGNDTGGAIVQLVVANHPNGRIGRIGLIACEAFDNVPPGLTGKTVVAVGKLPPKLFGAFMQQMRLKPIRRLPIAFGWLTKRGDKTTKQWMQPLLANADIRRDAVKALRIIGKNRTVLLDAAENLSKLDRPALIAWADRDRVMPPEHGRRLAELIPNSRLVIVEDTYTLIPLDQPALLTSAIRGFIRSTTNTQPTHNDHERDAFSVPHSRS